MQFTFVYMLHRKSIDIVKSAADNPGGRSKRFVLVIKRWLVWPKTSISIHAKLEDGICTSPIERLPVEQLDRPACKGGLNIAEVCDVGD